MRHIVLLFLLFLNTAFPQISPAATPEEIASIAMVALEEERYEDFASLMHPDALSQIRDFANLVISVSEANLESLNLFGANSVDEFHTISDTLIMANFIKAVMKNIDDKMKIHDIDLEIIGGVMEGADTIHIVSRSKMVIDEYSLSSMDINSLKRSPVGWRMLVNEQIQILMTGIRAGIDSKNKLR